MVFQSCNSILLKSSNKNKGFSLIELIIIISILGVLAGVSAPSLTGYINKARVSILKSNADTVRRFVEYSLVNYDKDHLFSNSDNSGSTNYEAKQYLSQYMEAYFEQAGYGNNNFSIINPYSKKDGILNYSNYKLNEPYCNQAIVISNSADLRHSSTALSAANGKKYLKGSIVISAINGNNTIEVYYVDNNGIKSADKQTVYCQ